MTSLGEAYGGAGTDNRRLYLGVGLFLVGALALVAAIAMTATDILTGAGFTVGEAREIGGVVGGIGAPIALLGVFTVMPAARRTRAAAIVGASVAILGVALFSHAYPCRWVNATCGGPATANLTLPTVGIYFVGSMTTLWCLFVGVANLKTRNDPGGTARLDVVRKNETKVVEVSESSPGFGGIGLFGADPDGEVATQTASDGGADSEAVVQSPTGTGTGRGGTGTTGATTSATTSGAQTGTTTTTRSRSRTGGQSNGTTTTQSTNGTAGTTSPTTRSGETGASTTTADRTRTQSGGQSRTRSTSGNTSGTESGSGRSSQAGDAYCGSCRHFEYVRTDEGMQPYCGQYEELMDDMDACEDWAPRGDGRLLGD